MVMKDSENIKLKKSMKDKFRSSILNIDIRERKFGVFNQPLEGFRFGEDLLKRMSCAKNFEARKFVDIFL